MLPFMRHRAWQIHGSKVGSALLISIRKSRLHQPYRATGRGGAIPRILTRDSQQQELGVLSASFTTGKSSKCLHLPYCTGHSALSGKTNIDSKQASKAGLWPSNTQWWKKQGGLELASLPLMLAVCQECQFTLQLTV